MAKTCGQSEQEKATDNYWHNTLLLGSQSSSRHGNIPARHVQHVRLLRRVVPAARRVPGAGAREPLDEGLQDLRRARSRRQLRQATALHHQMVVERQTIATITQWNQLTSSLLVTTEHELQDLVHRSSRVVNNNNNFIKNGFSKK